MARLVLERIAKRYGDATALAGVSLDVPDGEACVLVGPSGCGKSTLLRIAAGLVRPDEGRVLLDGRDVTALEPHERDVAMVFQSYALYPHMTVARNLEFPLRMRGVARAERRRRAHQVAERLGLVPLLQRKPAALSGGQMQRVALGRAIVRDPALFLFDEPLSNLDAQLRTEMRREITGLCRELGVTSLYVTHDQAEAMTMGRSVCVMSAGRVQQVGAPLDVYDRPANTFVAGFTGSPPMNLMRASVEGGRALLGEGVATALPQVAANGRDTVWLGFRPDEARLADSGGATLEVVHVEALGSTTHARARLGGHEIWVRVPADRRIEVGDRLALDLDATPLHAFDVATGARVTR